jgi:acyl carrier protein
MEQKIKEMVAYVLGCEESEVVPEASFKNDLGADSLDMADIVMGVENEFKIELSSDEMESIKVVKDLCEIVDKHRAS